MGWEYNPLGFNFNILVYPNIFFDSSHGPPSPLPWSAGPTVSVPILTDWNSSNFGAGSYYVFHRFLNLDHVTDEAQTVLSPNVSARQRGPVSSKRFITLGSV
jgi:hypothetical protein